MKSAETPEQMPKIKTLEQLLVAELKDLYSAEKQLTKALPKMAKGASHHDLKKGFSDHLKETEGHVKRLEEIAAIMGFSPGGKVCKAMKGLIEEGGEQIHEDALPALRDIAIITAAQKVEHYEISGYGTARALAKKLGRPDVEQLLKETEGEEAAADKKLTAVTRELLIATDFEAEAAPPAAKVLRRKKVK